jgi:uncharacterized protein (TIGR00290 family)
MRTMLSWSTGKDAAWSLQVLRETPGIDVCGLFTTVNAEFDRVAMHGVRREVLGLQADAAGLPLTTIEIPFPCPNDIYAARMTSFIEKARNDGIEAMAFGDLFLADIRAYRETMLAGTGITPLFPLWGMPTSQLAVTMIKRGLKAHVTCIDPRCLPRDCAGRPYDADFLANLPPGVDPCGENGEFHTLTVAGPMFASEIRVMPGAVVEREGFVFADFLPLADSADA